MIRSIAITKDLQLMYDISLEELSNENIMWYWIDFSEPKDYETALLESHFHFHHLSIKDCVYSLNSPKLDYHSNYNFLILNALAENTLDTVEVSLFVGSNYLVSYHTIELSEIDKAWELTKINEEYWDKGPSYIVHRILDNIVDNFFPAIHKIENRLNEIESNDQKKPSSKLMDEIFEVRSDLLKIRRVVRSMCDLLYRIINAKKLEGFNENKLYFSDIYHHLVKISEMIDSNREISSDMRDNYMSINSSRMNKHTMVLTVITSIFIPLSFIAGVYGMNFENMPELSTKYGYYWVLIIMTIIAIVMFFWFKWKGWFEL